MWSNSCLSLFPGRGIPNQLCQNNLASTINPENFPPAEIAAEHYFNDLGTNLTREAHFGKDPFKSEEDKLVFEAQFTSNFPDLNFLLSRTVNRDYRPLQEAALQLVDLTLRYL